MSAVVGVLTLAARPAARPLAARPAAATLVARLAAHHGGHPAVYDALVVVHVVCAVVGFGAVAVSGAYGAIGRTAGTDRSRPESVDEVRRFFRSGSAVEHLLLVAPLFGLAAMAVRPGGAEFGQLWAVAGLVIWLLAGVILLAVVRPAERAIRASVDDDAALGGAAGRLAWAAAACDLLFVVALLVMVTQPR